MFWISGIAIAQAFQPVQVVFNFQKPGHMIFQKHSTVTFIRTLDLVTFVSYNNLEILEFTVCRIYIYISKVQFI